MREFERLEFHFVLLDELKKEQIYHAKLNSVLPQYNNGSIIELYEGGKFRVNNSLIFIDNYYYTEKAKTLRITHKYFVEAV